MLRITGWLALLLIFGSVVAPVSAQEPDYGKIFNRYDTDGDGKVSPEDMGRPALFRRLDQNGDGVLLREEALKGMMPVEVEDPDRAGYEEPDESPQTSYLDIAYDEIEGVDPNFLSLDLYVPETAGEKRPVLIMIHGGGWFRGDKGNGGAKRHHFVGQGYVFANINYRLTPDDPADQSGRHPMHVQDCAKAVAWIHDHVAEYGGDPAQLHLMGHSAGGHLAGLLGTNERFLKAEGKDLSILKSNVLLDPAGLDMPRLAEKANGRVPGLFERAFGPEPAAWRDGSPNHHVSAARAHPPTLIFYAGERLGLNIDGPALAKALTEAGAPSKAVDTVSLSHTQIGQLIGMKKEPMTALVMRLHTGENAAEFPEKLQQ